jgi:tol-pal system protein YbgF
MSRPKTFAAAFATAIAATLLAGTASAQMPVPPLSVPYAGSKIVPVQALDPRVGQLEEQIRALNGRVEELNFLVLELQEMLRKQQKDNEFRFQELEGGTGGGTGGETGGGSGGASGGLQQNGDASGALPAAGTDTASAAPVAPGAGEPAQNLGTITFDAAGNPTGGAIVPGGTASIPAGLGDTELFDAAYGMILAGDYAAAESALKEHASRFPASARAADTRYWLGESQLGQEKFTDAAENFLAISREFPAAERAPEALLKLGVTMAALKKSDIACATFDEVMKRYPTAGETLKSRVATEKAAAQC